MVMQLNDVVPFGRSLDEYRQMFKLSADDLAGSIIGVADGPASFNAEMFAAGHAVVSVDPLYALSGPIIEQRFYAVVDNIIGQVAATPDDWVWNYHKSPAHLRNNRIEALTRFLADYEAGRRTGRYIEAALPDLDFRDGHFDLALCSHFLFLYSDRLSYEFHLQSVKSMLRVAREVRVFPLLTLMLEPSPYLPPLRAALAASGYKVSVETVPYELQRGGNQLLRIARLL